MNEPILLAAYDPAWAQQFRERASVLRAALGPTALRIDHIGSTAVTGLVAKPIIDMQISIASFEPFAAIETPLNACGYQWQADNPHLSKRYFRETPPIARTHIHVRLAGSLTEQLALAFRDYLRAHPDEAARYAAAKQDLAERFKHERDQYVTGKAPIIWELHRHMTEWVQVTGWQPAASDA